MLVHQCSSCEKLSKPSNNCGEPALPTFWARITIDKAWGNSGHHDAVTYDLCNDCAKQPIRFGNIELTEGE